MIESSLDWSGIENEMLSKLKECVYNKEVKRMIENVSVDVKKLSQLEVDDRRNRTQRSKELVKRINDNILMIDQYILMAKLIG